jgi:hypothetical protein
MHILWFQLVRRRQRSKSFLLWNSQDARCQISYTEATLLPESEICLLTFILAEYLWKCIMKSPVKIL